MARVYLTGSGQTKGHATGSGIISNPARVLLQERDVKLGSYPTIARTGDANFTGINNIFYDDTNTVNFVGSNLITYPSVLPQSSRFVSGGVSTPNTLQGIVTVSAVSKGVSDTHIAFASDQSTGPFEDNKVYIDNDSSFYQTGTATDILPGFNQRLSSKCIVSIDISPTSQTSVFFSTGTTPGPSVGGLDAGVNSGIAYFNFANKKWEIIGDLSTGSNVDFFNNSPTVRANSYVSTIPSAYYARSFSSFDFTPLAQLQGLPTNYAGFPLASKFNATSSQLYNMSSSLSAPFLCEGVQVIFSASVGQWPISQQPYSQTPQISTFVLMLERDTVENRIVTKTNRDLYDPLGVSSDAFIVTTTQHSVNRSREIIWFGRVGVVNVSEPNATGYGYGSISNFATQNPEIYSAADLWIPVNVTAFTGGAATAPVWTKPTGSFVLYSTCKAISLVTPVASPFFTIRDTALSQSLYDIEFGGRNLFDINSGRSFIGSISAAQLSSSISTPSIQIQGSTNWIKTYTDSVKVSPFVLQPNDRLIFAHVNQPHPFVDGGTLKVREDIPANIKNVFGEGYAKLNLFGSLLRNNQPVSPETNQPLTSDAVHEDLHYENPVFDQFDVEPTSTLSGSYIDLIITGSMLARPLGSPTAANVRRVQGSVAAGQAGTTGSLQRFVHLVSENDVYYDSFPSGTIGTSGARASAQFRRDRQGQFRDMLAQSPNAAYYVNRSVEYPLEIKFFSRPSRSGRGKFVTEPSKTHTQNLSPFATSSFPYFDGIARERSDDPDVTLADVYVG